MPKPVFAGLQEAPPLSAYQWFVLLSGTQFFHPHLQDNALEHQRLLHTKDLEDLRAYLLAHPVDPRQVRTMTQIRQWAEIRAFPLAAAGSAWPGSDHA